jgi:hypothetical protein
MSLPGILILAICFGLIVVSRRWPSLWIVGVLGRTIIVMFMALAAWFGGLMTGVITLDWLANWLGTPKLQPPWDRIALLGPSVIVGAAYFIYEMSRAHEARR